MSFNWDLYIQLASELIHHQKTPGIQEAYFRTAMSRSYYGVFCLARDILISKGIKIPRRDVHKFIREEYQKCPNKIGKKIAKDLRRSWYDRIAADYKGNAIINKNRAETSYQLSLRLLQNLRKL